MIKLDRKDNFNMLIQALLNENFRLVNGLNPCLIEFNGQSYYVYVKTLTPAQLSNNNPDVWRCQLPKQKKFEDIKNSAYKFILLGYDAENDVYATWNPYWAKQRLNVGSSVSMYSRLNLQIQAAQNNEIIKYSLNRQGEVIIFPRTLLPDVLDNIKTYFPEETKYTAIGSSLRSNNMNENIQAEKLYNDYTSQSTFLRFKDYMLNEENAISLKSRKSYIAYIKFVIDKGLWEKYKDAYLKYSSIDDYNSANADFLAKDEIAFIDRPGKGGWHGAIKAALKYYLAFYIKSRNNLPEVPTDKTKYGPAKEPELPFLVEDNSKPNILEPELIEKIVPLMCQEEPDKMSALQILSEHFGDKYNDTMQFQDWLALVDSVDWFVYSKKKDNYVFEIDKNKSLATTEDLNEIIEYFAKAFMDLPVKQRSYFLDPHNYVLLLSVMSLISIDEIKSPFIELTDDLIRSFNDNWKRFVPRNSPYRTPMLWKAFMNLANSSFWMLVPKDDAIMDETPMTLDVLKKKYKGALIPKCLFDIFRYDDFRYNFRKLLTTLMERQIVDEQDIKRELRKIKVSRKDHKTFFWFSHMINGTSLPDIEMPDPASGASYNAIIYKSPSKRIVALMSSDLYELERQNHLSGWVEDTDREDEYKIIGYAHNGILKTDSLTAYKLYSYKGAGREYDFSEADYYAVQLIKLDNNDNNEGFVHEPITTDEISDLYRIESNNSECNTISIENYDIESETSENDTNKDIEYYKKVFCELKVNKTCGFVAPHKAVLLSAIIQLIGNGHYTNNLITLDDELVETFAQIWRDMVGIHSVFNSSIDKPFYYMKSEPFWSLKQNAFWIEKPSYSTKDLQKYYAGAEIDKELFTLLQFPVNRLELLTELENKYFNQ